MKIGFLAETNSIHTVRWINYLKHSGINVFAITNKINHELDVKQYELKYGLPLFISSEGSAFRNAISPLSVLQVRKILKKEKPDILHAHYVSSYGFLGALSNFRPLVLTAWGSDILLNLDKYCGVLKWMVKTALSKATLITCDAEHIQNKIMLLGGKNIKTIYFGTDIKKFKPEPKYDLSPVIISLRNHEPLYDIETLIRAIPEVLKKCFTAYFLICGSGSQTEYLKNLTYELRVHNSVEFCGKVDSKQYLGQATIYVSTSTSDAGLSASTAEAMSCGLPVVVTDFGDNSYWIKNGVNGYIFPVGDYIELAKQIIKLIEDKDTAKNMGLINRRIIETKLNEEIEMNKMIKLYEESI